MIKPRAVVLIIMIVFLLVGVILLCVSLGIFYADRKKRIHCTEKTNGTVINVEMETTTPSVSEAPIVSWYPTFEYQVNGTVIQKRSSIGGAKDDLFKGQQVTVYYNPNNPNEYYVAEENTHLIKTIFMSIGTVCILIGFGCLWALKTIVI